MFCRKNSGILKCIFYIFIPVITFLLVEWLQGVFPNILTLNFWLNIMCYFGIFLLFHGITKSLFWGTIPVCALICFLGTINHYMIAIRSKALLPWEIFALTTAKNLNGNFSLTFEVPVAGTIVVFILIAILAWRFKKTKLFRNARYATFFAGIILLATIWGIMWEAPKSISSDPWYTVDASRQNGMLINLVHNIKSMINPKPEGYSPERVREIIGSEEKKEGYDTPDIIVIMDESFADLSSIAPLNEEHDFIPFIRSLSDNTISGNIRVSVFGGGTCNTEYEFLTGNATPMLRVGSYPMVQFVKKDSPSIAKTLRAAGYRTIGLHSFYPDGWNRDMAYPQLGFDKFLCNHDFENPEYVREYISDDSSFDKIIELLEEDTKPAFIFNVTMQNHFGYEREFDNLIEDAVFPEMEEFPQARRYFSLLSLTDKAVRDLVEYLEKRERPTILLFFGDHMPAVESEYYDILKERAGLSDDEMHVKKHTVPFFIWANYDIPEQKDLYISSSFLSPLLLECANAPMSEHQTYLSRLMERMPLWENGDSEDVLGYKIVQYNMVFDKFKKQGDLFE